MLATLWTTKLYVKVTEPKFNGAFPTSDTATLCGLLVWYTLSGLKDSVEVVTFTLRMREL